MKDRVERFIKELARVGGIAQAFERREEAVERLLKLLKERGVHGVVLEPSPLLDELKIPQALREAGFEVLIAEEPRRLRGAEAGVGGALAAVAESGTLLLGGPPKGLWQWVSLLPPLHTVFLEAERIRPSLEEGFQALEEARARGLEEFVWITGPSRTADIAQTPLLGMHGPGELHVFIIQ